VLEARLEQAVQLPGLEVRSGADLPAEIRIALPGRRRGLLHDAVGLLPVHPPFDQRQQHLLGEDQPAARLEGRPHPLREDAQVLEDVGGQVEHVIERDRGIGEGHPLHRRMRDVALVPQGHVLEGGLEVGAHDAGQPRDALAHDRVALVRHRARTLLARLERLLDLANLGARQVADLHGDLLERRGGDRQGAHVLGVPVALDHLRGGIDGSQAELAADVLLDERIDGRVRAHGAAHLADGDRLTSPAEPLAIAVQLEGPHRHLVAEGGRLRVDAVGPGHTHRVAMLERQALDRRQHPLELRQEEAGCFAELEGQRRVEEVAGGHPEVDPPTGRPHRLRGGLDEGGHVVPGRLLELPDPGRVGRGATDCFQVFGRDTSQPGPRLAGQDLDPETVGQLRLLRPHRPHLGKGVSRDHAGLVTA
jgi:hypothetical protein